MRDSPRKSPETENDLREIWRYISENSAKAADTMLNTIEHTFSMLAEYPRSGVGRSELVPGLRSFPCESYIIFYFVVADGIEVVRVMHARRDITPNDVLSSRG